ncbi:unnamed protein product [Rotaria sp. Silwood2]|nr:unnamed protein product [Rotaria sp. Silwood2]
MYYKLKIRNLFRIFIAHEDLHIADSLVTRLPIPDIYRGKYRDIDYNYDEEKLCQLYVDDVRQIVEEIESRGRRIAIFLIESLQSCGGQIIYPKGYLKHTFDYLQSKGILCLVDEVQTGFGRSGTHFWAFQSYEEDIVPDFVTMGKSMGNGFPVAALVTRRCITQKFDMDGIEYFNTYGGNPVSCRAAIAVLDIIEREKLMENARDVGSYLLNKLKEIGKKYYIIGDVRGRGFFLGVEFVRDAKTREPGIEEAHEIKYKLREHMIIVSLDGPDHNVLKFKSPMCFSKADADFLCGKLETLVRECQNKRDEKQETIM